MTDRRLIEDSLPLDELSRLSARDKAGKKPHLRNLLLYWSCKPLPASRVIAYASAVAAPKTEEELEAEMRFVKRLAAYGVEHLDRSVIQEASKRIKDNFPSGLRFHDPFSGSGAHSVEAQRLGAHASAGDLNPVAALLSDAVIRLIPKSSQLRLAGTIPGRRLDGEVEVAERNVQIRAERLVAPLYAGQPHGHTPPFAYIWNRTAVCSNPACRQEVPLTTTWALSKASGNKWALVPSFAANGLETRVVKGLGTGPKTVSRSKIICPWCDSVSPHDYLRNEAMAGRVGHRLMAVAWQSKTGKEYRLPTQKEISAARPNPVDSTVSFPPFPQDDSRKFTPALFGVSSWEQLHTARQLQALQHYAAAISEELDLVEQRSADLDADTRKTLVQAVGFVLAAALCRMADLMTSLCGWEPNAQAVRHLFTGKAVPMMWNYGEANPTAGASGSWKLCVKRTRASLALVPRDYEGSAAMMAAAQDIEVERADVIVTDPPYYDAIAYAHLSDFFVPWLRSAMGQHLPQWFSVTSTPKRREIIQRPSGPKTKSRFEVDMADALARMHKNLKDEGIMTLVYAHKSTEAWETLLEALLGSGFVVVATWPVETEMAARKDARGNASLASTVYFVCRKRAFDEDGFIDDVTPEIERTLHERLEYFWSQGIRGADFFMSAIGPAVQVFGRYKRVLKLTGQEVTIAELLDTVRGIVADYALQQIVHGERAGDVDEASRFYVIWRWAFGTTDVHSGEAIHMAQSMGCEFSELSSDKGVLLKKKDKVTLRGPIDRISVKGLGKPSVTGGYAPLVDVLHKASNLWAAGERQELADFLVEALPAGSADRMQRLAQSIVDVLVPGDKERGLYENFLVGSRSLPKPTTPDASVNQQKLAFERKP